MFIIKRTTSDDAYFQMLVAHLDKYLSIMDGDEHAFYAQYNKIDNLKNTVVCYVDNMPVGCGAFKKYEEDTVEIKRMFVLPEYRGKGVAAAVLSELEKWAAELQYHFTVLETGKRQVEAVKFYRKSGYEIIPNYGQYKNIENSICMKKSV